MLSKRVQVLVEKAEYERFKKIAKRSHKSMGELFRDAVKLYGERLVSKAQRLAVAENMTKLKGVVSDWGKMEADIIKARSK